MFCLSVLGSEVFPFCGVRGYYTAIFSVMQEKTAIFSVKNENKGGGYFRFGWFYGVLGVFLVFWVMFWLRVVFLLERLKRGLLSLLCCVGVAEGEKSGYILVYIPEVVERTLCGGRAYLMRW